MKGLRASVGYGLTTVLLAVAALVIVPSMVAAGGPDGWGAVALGQSVGTVGAALVGYGWALSGPAVIARADATGRRREFWDSLLVRLFLLVPTGLVAGVLSALLIPAHPHIAALASTQAVLMGLSVSWYFVGIAAPYALLWLETVPRVLGSALAIGLMYAGASLATGVVCQILGTLLALLITTSYITARLRREGARTKPGEPLFRLLARHRHGLTTNMGSIAYNSAPIVLVAALAPAAQPLYALVDKVQRQLVVAMAPIVNVMQGWVPRGRGIGHRERQATLAGAGLGLGAVAGVIVFGPWVLGWMSQGTLHPGWDLIVLMGVFVGITLFEWILARAVLASYGELRVTARGTLIGVAVGLPLIALGSVTWGATGAALGLVGGMAVRTAIELIATLRIWARERPADGPPSTSRRAH